MISAVSKILKPVRLAPTTSQQSLRLHCFKSFQQYILLCLIFFFSVQSLFLYYFKYTSDTCAETFIFASGPYIRFCIMAWNQYTVKEWTFLDHCYTAFCAEETDDSRTPTKIKSLFPPSFCLCVRISNISQWQKDPAAGITLRCLKFLLSFINYSSFCSTNARDVLKDATHFWFIYLLVLIYRKRLIDFAF